MPFPFDSLTRALTIHAFTPPVDWGKYVESGIPTWSGKIVIQRLGSLDKLFSVVPVGAFDFLRCLDRVLALWAFVWFENAGN